MTIYRPDELLTAAATTDDLTEALTHLIRAHALTARHLPTGGGHAQPAAARDLAEWLTEGLAETGWTPIPITA